jgi:5,5'-dehydrodivanillate O-demethylase
VISEERNQVLTSIGPGTAMGQLFRRYWHPVAAAAELVGRDTKQVRILGEDLVVYKDLSGNYGLLPEACPHRGASLAWGIPEQRGLRCMYHGWWFDSEGRCVEQPNEPVGSRFAERVRIDAYPVAEYGGLLFAYLGPGPAPSLPKWDVLALGYGDHVIKQVSTAVLPCNWLQIMENSLDPVHGEWLHGRFPHYRAKASGKENISAATISARKHVRIGFDRFEWGIVKRRMLEGQTEQDDDWKVGHPVLFPNVLKVGGHGRYELQYRVPVDDTHTLHFWYQAVRPPESIDIPRQEVVPHLEMPFKDENGAFIVDTINGQDIMAWVSQGGVTDRTKEHLGATDRGVTMYRLMLREELSKVEKGEDPIGVLRAEPDNGVIKLPVEENKLGQGTKASATLFGSWRTVNAPEVQKVVDQMASL